MILVALSNTDWTHIENILAGLAFFVFFMTIAIIAYKSNFF